MIDDPPRCEAVHPVHGRCMRDAGHPVDDKNGHETAVSSKVERAVLVRGIDGEPAVRWPRRWMVRELLDDHRQGKVTSRNAIGLLLVPGALPRLVACGDPAQVARWAERGDEPTYCCCEVYRDQADGTEHLSSWSTLTLSGKQLADLHLYGEIGGEAMAYSACRVVLLDEDSNDDEARPICPGCKNEIDPDVCGCGDSRDGHYSEDHAFVPANCECLKVKR